MKRQLLCVCLWLAVCVWPSSVQAFKTVLMPGVLRKPFHQIDEAFDHPINDEFILNSKRIWSNIAWNGTGEAGLVLQLPREESRGPSIQDFLDGSAGLTEAQHQEFAKHWKSMTKYMSYYKSWSEGQMNKLYDALKIAFVAAHDQSQPRGKAIYLMNKVISMSQILSEIKAKPETAIAAILHDALGFISTLDDADYWMEEICNRFDHNITQISKKYSKLPDYLPQASYSPDQAERLMQYLIVMGEDYYVLSLRVAEKLVELRELKNLGLSKVDEAKMAQEVLDVYVPMVHKMKWNHIKQEMEDICFRVLDKEMFDKTKVAQHLSMKVFGDAEESINAMMDNDEFLKKNRVTKTNVSNRVKSKYQIYLKMKRKGLSDPSKVRDTLGLRIVFNHDPFPFETKEDYEARGKEICYYLAEKLRAMPGWRPAADGFKDYILNAKENGYQCLHQHIESEKSKATFVEVQIRTFEMHKTAELGEAAHWYYKDILYRADFANSPRYRAVWRSKEQMEAKSEGEMFGIAKNYLLKNRVFIFLEDKSHIVDLKKESTALDAAFSIHSAIGLAARDVLVNGISVPLNRQLRNGDVVSVKVNEEKHPAAHISWFNMVKTNRALTELRKHFRAHSLEALVVIGLVQLLSSISYNKDLILKKYANMPHADRIIKWTKTRTGYSLIDGLVFLATTPNKDDIKSHISKLFGLPEAELYASTTEPLTWASLQANSGWDEEDIFQSVISPFLEILPLEEGLSNFKSVWVNLFGEASVNPVKDIRAPLTIDTIISQADQDYADSIKKALESSAFPLLARKHFRNSSFSVLVCADAVNLESVSDEQSSKTLLETYRELTHDGSSYSIISLARERYAKFSEKKNKELTTAE